MTAKGPVHGEASGERFQAVVFTKEEEKENITKLLYTYDNETLLAVSVMLAAAVANSRNKCFDAIFSASQKWKNIFYSTRSIPLGLLSVNSLFMCTVSRLLLPVAPARSS